LPLGERLPRLSSGHDFLAAICDDTTWVTRSG
jgi:hypothetical protein